MSSPTPLSTLRFLRPHIRRSRLRSGRTSPNTATPSSQDAEILVMVDRRIQQRPRNRIASSTIPTIPPSTLPNLLHPPRTMFSSTKELDDRVTGMVWDTQMDEWKIGDKKIVEVRYLLTRIKSVIIRIPWPYGSEAPSPGSSVLGPYSKRLLWMLHLAIRSHTTGHRNPISCRS